MKTELYDKILTLLEGTEKVSFTIFYDKAIGDGDIVARLEEEITKLKQSLKDFDHLWSDDAKLAITSRIAEYEKTLHGDKPSE